MRAIIERPERPADDTADQLEEYMVEDWKTWTMGILDKWSAKGLVDGYDIRVEFINGRHPDDRPPGIRYTAEVFPDWRYLFATIKVYLPTLATGTDPEETLVHELVHIPLEAMNCKNIGHEERATTVIARTLLNLERGINEKRLGIML